MFKRSKRATAAAPVRRYSRQRPFVDRVKVLLASGAGGDGASIMGSLMNNEFAGPMGGNGGRGGDLFVVSSRRVQDLAHISEQGSQIVAEKGQIGFNLLSSGRKGQSIELVVPVGTQVVDVDTNQIVVDLDETDLKVLLLEGGQGGKGNANFANNIVHSPKDATRGLPGNTMLANIELKLIADCGLVGYPNAGKSSLLNAISTSRPKIANYPFTTLSPYVGQVHDIYGQTCSVADLPGLIEGAYENRGLGHQFLRHVERTTAIAFVIDMYSPFVPSDASIGSAMAAAASLEAAAAQHVASTLASSSSFSSAAGAALRHEAEDSASSAARTAAVLSLQSSSRGGLREELDAAVFPQQGEEGSSESFAEYAKKHPDQFMSEESSSAAAAANNSYSSNTKGTSSTANEPYQILNTVNIRMQEPWEVLETLQNELEFYLPGLSEKGLLVFANKMDMEKDAAGNCMKAKLEELRKRTHLPVFPISAKKGIDFGAHHSSTGLSAALAHITRHVYAAKKAKEELNINSKKNLDEELDSVFRGRNVSHFAPVDFTTWRARVKSKSGGFSGFDGASQMTDSSSSRNKNAFATGAEATPDHDDFGDGNNSFGDYNRVSSANNNDSVSSKGRQGLSARGSHHLIDHRVSAEDLLDAEAPPMPRGRHPTVTRDPEAQSALDGFDEAGNSRLGFAGGDAMTSKEVVGSTVSTNNHNNGMDYGSGDGDDYDIEASCEGEDPFAADENCDEKAAHGEGKPPPGNGRNERIQAKKGEWGFSADEFEEALARSNIASASGLKHGHSNQDALPTEFYRFDGDTAAAHRFAMEGGARTRSVGTFSSVSGGENIHDNDDTGGGESRFIGADGIRRRNDQWAASTEEAIRYDANGYAMDVSAVDVDAEVEGPYVSPDDMQLSNTRLTILKQFRGAKNADAARFAQRDVAVVPSSGSVLSSREQRQHTKQSNTVGDANNTMGFFLKRQPKRVFDHRRAETLPTLANSATFERSNQNSSTIATDHNDVDEGVNVPFYHTNNSRPAAFLSEDKLRGTLRRRREKSSSSSSHPDEMLSSLADVKAYVRNVMEGRAPHGDGAGDAVALEGQERTESLSSSLPTTVIHQKRSPSGRGMTQAPAVSAAILAARKASAEALAAERQRHSGGNRSSVLDVSELSLVDQQLDDVVGQSGYGEVFDAYKHCPTRSKFGNYRDPSLRGQYWKRSRLPGEKLPDEKWQ